MRKRGKISTLLAVVLLSTTGVCYGNNTEADKEKEVRFIDTDESWAKEYIEEVTKDGVLLGVDEIHFCPKAYMTRGEFTGVLARILKLNGEKYTGKFKDVEGTYYYADDIEQLSDLGILCGYEEGYFKPNKELTREEMVSLFVRAYEYIKGEAVSCNSWTEIKFIDSDQISKWALEDIKKACELGFIEGDEQNRLNPRRLATREETAKLIIVFHT